MSKQYVTVPDYLATDFHIPYVCSFSPLLRATTQIFGKKEELQHVVEGIVKDINSNEKVADSLKIPAPIGTQITRQVDIRLGGPDNPVILKSFITWDFEQKHWLVFLESVLENHWEQEKIPKGVN